MIFDLLLVVLLEVGTYREREDAQCRLVASSLTFDQLLVSYKECEVQLYPEMKVRLKYILKEKWRLEKTKKYALYIYDDTCDLEGVKVSETMLEDFERELNGE